MGRGGKNSSAGEPSVVCDYFGIAHFDKIIKFKKPGNFMDIQPKQIQQRLIFYISSRNLEAFSLATYTKNSYS